MPASPLIRAALRALRTLLPAACAACDAASPPDQLFCRLCAETIGPPLRGLLRGGTPWHCAARHRGALATAIHRLKYGGRPDLARALGRWTAPVALGPRADAESLVPVPLHPGRLAERGFNQAALIAAALSGILDLPVQAMALRRNTYTASQASLPRSARLANVHGRFSARGHLAGQRVVLVDDVLTTGATALACIEALHEAGARTVGIVAVTRGGQAPVEYAEPLDLM